MLFNRIQSTSALLSQTQFSFATKNLKQIKLRMKAVESIKKITKVFFITFFRPWRWSPQPRWRQTSTGSRKPRPSVLDQSKRSLTAKPSSKRKDNPSHPKSGFWSQSLPTRVSVVVQTQVSSDKSDPWLEQIEAHIGSSSLVTRVHQPFHEQCQTSSIMVSPTSRHQWTSPQVLS